MKLNISPSEWNVLWRNLRNSKTPSFKATEIIEEHKKILNDFKEKLKERKRKALEKFKKQLKKKEGYGKDVENKILKFESEQEEKMQEDFKDAWFKVMQDVEGKT